MNKTRKLLLLTSSCLVLLISLSSAYGQNESPDELYSECVRVAGKELCDFLFKRVPDSASKEIPPPPNYFLQSVNNVSSSSISNSTYLTYDDNDNGFSIQHPSDWLARYSNSKFNTVISFYPPETQRAQVDIRIAPSGDYKSIKEFGDNEFKEFGGLTLLAYYRNSTTQLSGKPALRAVYLIPSTLSPMQNLYGENPSQAKVNSIWTMVPEKKSVYGIVYFADPTIFDKYLPVIENMVNSFKIYGKGPVIQGDNSSSSNP